MIMLKIFAIWLADRYGLFEETEAAARAYLTARDGLQTQIDRLQGRITATKTEHQHQIACREAQIDEIIQRLSQDVGLTVDADTPRVIRLNTLIETISAMQNKLSYRTSSLKTIGDMVSQCNLPAPSTGKELIESLQAGARTPIATSDGGGSASAVKSQQSRYN
jgi:TolA-binding protein